MGLDELAHEGDVGVEDPLVVTLVVDPARDGALVAVGSVDSIPEVLHLGVRPVVRCSFVKVEVEGAERCPVSGAPV